MSAPARPHLAHTARVFLDQPPYGPSFIFDVSKLEIHKDSWSTLSYTLYACWLRHWHSHGTALTSHGWKTVTQSLGTGSSTGSTATLECGVRGDRGGSDRRRVAVRPRTLAPPHPATIFSAGHFWADDYKPAPISKGKLTAQPGLRPRLQVQRPIPTRKLCLFLLSTLAISRWRQKELGRLSNTQIFTRVHSSQSYVIINFIRFR